MNWRHETISKSSQRIEELVDQRVGATNIDVDDAVTLRFNVMSRYRRTSYRFAQGLDADKRSLWLGL